MSNIINLENELKILQETKQELIKSKCGQDKVRRINNQIKSLKRKIRELKDLQELEFDDIIFDGGKVVFNKSIRRIQFVFDNVPNKDIVATLKSTGFRITSDIKVWERYIKKNSIYATEYVLHILEKTTKNKNKGLKDKKYKII